MAAVLNFDQQSAPSRAQAKAAMATVIAHCQSLPALTAVPRIAAFRAQLDAVEATSLATVIGSNGDTKTAERIASKGGRTSKRERRRTAKRASAVKKNADLAEKMATGAMSGEQVDVLADAAAKTDGASLTDDELIDSVAAVNPDLGKGVIDKYLLDKNNAGQAQTRHDRQRASRRVSRFTTKDDCEAILIAGDKATIDRIWAATTRRANAFYQAAGSRELPTEQHPRNHDQRMFDAIVHGFDMGTDPTATSPSTQGDPGEPGSTGTTGDGPTPSRRHTPKATTTRPTVVITTTLEKFLGLDPDQAAELIGTGPIADSVLAEYLAADPDIVGMLFGSNGQPLWLSRNQRLASNAQVTALVIRDKGCVLCGAHHERCRAHHLMPWSAPAQGETDITKLALVCDSCHHFIHDNNFTLYQHRRRSKNGTTYTWQTRPALPHEIPPSRPPKPARAQGPQRT